MEKTLILSQKGFGVGTVVARKNKLLVFETEHPDTLRVYEVGISESKSKRKRNVLRNNMKILNWARCNILNKHIYMYLGDKDLYGQEYWRCIRCCRVKHKNCNVVVVEKESAKIRENFVKTLK